MRPGQPEHCAADTLRFVSLQNCASQQGLSERMSFLPESSIHKCALKVCLHTLLLSFVVLFVFLEGGAL